MTIFLPFPLPRDWLHLIETALTTAQRSADAEALRAGRPRDLDAVSRSLPDDVLIRFKEVNDDERSVAGRRAGAEAGA